jgi:exonuclease SbcC
MKILAIRGCNLASLDGEFEVDFRKEPLDSAGIFAITGNTGAGKTTILDAMCIALYRESPRLDNIEGGDYIEQSMRVNDIRSILRKGRGRGYAEVDFLAVDGKEYRVRWSISRAHGRPDGKMQSAEMYISSTRIALCPALCEASTTNRIPRERHNSPISRIGRVWEQTLD